MVIYFLKSVVIYYEGTIHVQSVIITIERYLAKPVNGTLFDLF